MGYFVVRVNSPETGNDRIGYVFNSSLRLTGVSLLILMGLRGLHLSVAPWQTVPNLKP